MVATPERGACGSTGSYLRGDTTTETTAARSTSFLPHCEEPACVTVSRPAPATSARRTDCSGEPGHLHRMQALLLGRPYGARGVRPPRRMKKCTLCIDKIYNENLEEVDRVPACVWTVRRGAGLGRR